MASRRVGYPEVMSWPSVFIRNVSPCSVCILTSLPSSLIPPTLAHFCSFLSCMRIKCWVSIMTCGRSVFAADGSSPLSFVNGDMSHTNVFIMSYAQGDKYP